MKAQAQGLSSAANFDGSALRGFVFGRSDNATRASSLSADGSGAPSHRGRFTVLALAIAAFTLLALTPLSQAKSIVSGFGSAPPAPISFGPGVQVTPTPPMGGQFSKHPNSSVTGINSPGGAAINNTGAGGVARGTLYVVDSGNNRVQRFSPSGDFERTWGQNVSGRDERQLVTIEGSIGSFTLSFGGDTARLTLARQSGSDVLVPVPERVRAALEALPSIGVGNVQVTGALATTNTPQGGSFLVQFTRTLGGTNVPQLAIDGSQLSGQPPISASVSTVENGFGGTFGGFEICTVATSCKDGERRALAGFSISSDPVIVGGVAANGGQLGTPRGIAVSQATGHVYVSEQNNRRISEFDADGNFIRAWGSDVVLSGRAGDVPGTSEAQTVALNAAATGGKFRLLFGAEVGTGASGSVRRSSGSNILSEFTTGSGSGSWAVGQVITGTGIPNDTTITGIDLDKGTLSISAPAISGSATSTNVTGHDIPWDASPAQVQAALEKLPTIGPGNVRVTSANPGGGRVGGPYTITFQGALADTDVPQVTGGNAGLRGTRTITPATTVPGVVGGFEICSVATECKSAAASGADGGRFTAIGHGDSVNDIPIGYPVIDASNDVWVPDPGNRRIQKFDPSGNFIAAYGYGVVDGGATGTGTVTNGSRSIASVVTTSKAFSVGQTITGTGIDPGTRITAIAAGRLDISQAATPAATGAGTVLTVAPGAGNTPGNEQHTVTLGSNTTGGTFTLSFRLTAPDSTTNVTTSPIAYDAPASGAGSVQDALERLANIGAGNVSVTGAGGASGIYTITFQGTRFADTNVSPLTSTATGLTVSIGSPTATVATIREGGALEGCTSTAPGACRAGLQGAILGQFGASSPTKIAFDSAGNLYAIDAGNNPNVSNNNRVQKFDPTLTSASNFAAPVFAGLARTAPTEMISTQGGRRLLFRLRNDVTASPPENQLVEIDSTDSSVKDTSLVGSRIDGSISLPPISGLAENSTSGDIYVGYTAVDALRRVLVLSSNPSPAPVPTMSAVSTKTDSTATFSGTIDPRGGWVTCKFQYSTDATVWTDLAEADCDSLALGGGPQAISENVTGLLPNTHYFVRLSVSRPLSAGSTVNTLPKVFDTDGPAPAITNLGSVEISDTSARIVATIDPRNSATSYVIEYGTTPSLGSSTAPVNIGGGTTPLLVSQAISGLRPNTTYYFKVVASNLTGSTSTASKTFTTRTDPLPAAGGRRYEQVSPADKNFGGVDFGPLVTSVASPDGEAASFCTGSGLSTDPAGQVSGDCTDYVSRRTPTGWGTRWLGRPICNIPGLGRGSFIIPTLNLDYALLAMPFQDFCDIPALSPDAPRTGTENKFILYRENTLTDPASFDVVAPVVTDFRVRAGNVPTFSDDGSHIVYPSAERQTDDAFVGATNVFDWHNGTLDLVSRDTGDQPLRASSTVPPSAVNGVSARGDRIFFQSPIGASLGENTCSTAACELYLREGGARTHWVSEQECSVACPNAVAADVFEWASLDGSRALFRSGARLTDDDTTIDGDAISTIGSDLYLYTRSDNPATDRNLTLVSKDNEPADGNVADVQGVLGISDDASVAYFVANGQIVLGGPTAAGPKVYRWRWNGGFPTVNYITTLSPGLFDRGGDVRHWNGVDDRPLIRYVSADGRYLLVQTGRQLDPIADRDSDRDIYRWGAQEGWACASCQAPGAPSSGASRIDGTDLTGQSPVTNQGLSNAELRIVMSDDGKRIFFTTTDALVPGDVNAGSGCVYSNGAPRPCEDVYEWHDGTVNLISGGHDTRDVLLMGASRDGDDVFFITFESLVGWDTDANTDVYDARLGGGFPEPPDIGVPCEGEACRGPVSVAPTITGAGTREFINDGPITTPRPRKCPRGKRKVTRNGRTRCIKRQRRNANNNRRATR